MGARTAHLYSLLDLLPQSSGAPKIEEFGLRWADARLRRSHLRDGELGRIVRTPGSEVVIGLRVRYPGLVLDRDYAAIRDLCAFTLKRNVSTGQEFCTVNL